MSFPSPSHSPRRLIAFAAAAIMALAVSGCGGSGHSSAKTATHASTGTTGTGAPSSSAPVRTSATASTVGCPTGQPSCITRDLAATVLGSENLSTNMTQLVGHDQRRYGLVDVVITCPVATLKTFPTACTLTGYDKQRYGKISGTATVENIYTLTHTYTYQLLYGKAKKSATGASGATGTSGASGSAGV